MEYSFEFLPHYASGVERKATFSLYESTWNEKWKFGLFEVHINLPTLIYFPYEINIGSNHKTFLDGKIRDQWNDWNEKRLYLYETYKNKVLTSMPNGLIFLPNEHLCWKFVFNFSLEERLKIAKLFNFKFNNEKLKNIFFTNLDIHGAILEGDISIAANRTFD